MESRNVNNLEGALVSLKISPAQSQKREGYLKWDDYFMATAFLAAKRSKDPVSQVGACIVDGENRIVGTGYNGFPRGCSDDDFPWSKSNVNDLENKYMYVVHAEANAILNKNAADIRGSRLYVALFPCNECAKLIIQSGIVEIIYMSDKHSAKYSTIASKLLLDKCGIIYRKYEPEQNKIVIDFNEIDWDSQYQVPPTPVKTL